MNMLSKIGPPTGIWAAAWSILRSPTALAGVLVVLGIMATVGVSAEPGRHPAAGVLYRLTFLLLPLMGLARAMDKPSGRQRWGGLMLAAGLATIGISTWQVSHSSGWLHVGQSPVETYERSSVNGPVSVHLGAQLNASVTGETASVTFGMRDKILAGPTQLSVTSNSEGQLGRFKLHVSHKGKGRLTDVAELVVTKKGESGGQTQTLRLRAGAIVSVDEETTIRLLQVRPDYMATLGAAAEVQLTWSDQVDTFWVYADAPGMDERLGRAPWQVRLVSLQRPQHMVMGLRLANSSDAAIWFGLTLVMLGLLLSVGKDRKMVAS